MEKRFKNYIFLGGGCMAERLYRQLNGNGMVLAGVADTLSSDTRKVKEFKGHAVRPLEQYGELIKNGTAAVLAVNAFFSMDAIHIYLEKCGFPEEALYVPNPYTTLRPCVMNDEFAAEQRIPVSDPRYQEVGALFEDALSEKIYRLLVESKQYDNKEDSFELLAYSQIKDMYWFSEDYWNTYAFQKDGKGQMATVIDCGAYIGDSILPLCKSIPEDKIRYYAFEPDGENASMIRNNPEFANICQELHVMEYGVGDEDKEMFFGLVDDEQKYGGRFVEHPTEEHGAALEIRRLDSMELDISGTVYVKMDIEGSELAALKGACRFIKEHRPYMAICMYHRKNDLVEIPLYLKNLVPDYQFYLRGGFHTILWAVPKEKA